MILPLYDSASSGPPKRGSGGHAGLWFDKFCDKWTIEGDSWSMSSDGRRNSKLDWIRTLTGGTVGSNAQIEEAAHRTIRLVEGRGGKCMIHIAESRFVTGLGRSHPVENGFAWHPTLGTPYLPGSSVKGMARAWATQDGGPGSNPEPVNRLFGEPGRAGEVCFLDAIPTEPVQLEADVMTPHYAGWTREDPPGDWCSPTPIPFLVTAAHTSFLFSVMPRCATAKADTETAMKWIREALEWAGAGAKTAVGYGRFAPDSAKTDELKKLLAEADRQRKEHIRQALEDEKLSPVEREIRKLHHSQQYRQMPESTAIYKAIEDGRWSGEEKMEAVQWLEAKMKTDGVWKETSRRPEKDKAHQRTRQVMHWLEEGE